jgi:hypothetical protein
MVQSLTTVWQSGSQLLLVFQLSLVRSAPLIATVAAASLMVKSTGMFY